MYKTRIFLVSFSLLLCFSIAGCKSKNPGQMPPCEGDECSTAQVDQSSLIGKKWRCTGVSGTKDWHCTEIGNTETTK